MAESRLDIPRTSSRASTVASTPTPTDDETDLFSRRIDYPSRRNSSTDSTLNQLNITEQKDSPPLISANPAIITKPLALPKPAAIKIPLKMKIAIYLPFCISALAAALSCSSGLVIRFGVIKAAAGAGFTIATNLLIVLTAVAAVVAMSVLYLFYMVVVKKTVNETTTSLTQIDTHTKEIENTSKTIQENLKQTFAMLINMNLALAKLRTARQSPNKKLTPPPPTPVEEELASRIDQYIEFLALYPNANLEAVEEKHREEALRKITNLKKKLNSACNNISEKQTLEKCAETFAMISFPHTWREAPMKQPVAIDKRALARSVTLGFLTPLGSIVGFSYTTTRFVLLYTITIANLAIPPIAVIFTVAFVVATIMAIAVYKSKRFDAEKKAEATHLQEKSNYLTKAHTCLEERMKEENKDNLILNEKYENQNLKEQLLQQKTSRRTSPSLTRLFLATRQSLFPNMNSSTPSTAGSISLLDSTEECVIEVPEDEGYLSPDDEQRTPSPSRTPSPPL